jgi:hypothetical protein
MSTADSAAPNAPQSQAAPQDIQSLIALLGSLVPLLLRIQSQNPMSMSPLLQGGAGPYALANPLVDQQAAVTFVEDLTAQSLHRLSAYLEANTGKYPALGSCVPIVTQATHCLAARDYAQAFELIWQAYRLITAIRATNPQLPPLRAVEPGAPMSSQTGSGSEARVH